MLKKEINNVTDIIDIEYLQNVQDSLGRIVGITTALLDPNGVPISRPTNLHAFCAMMQASESGVQMCMRTNGQLIEINKETHAPAIVTCPNSGLKTAAVPIFLGEQYLGSWLIGQIRMDNIDYELIESTAEKAGLSKEEAKKNISLLPVIGDVEFENVLSFLVTMTKTLTDMVEVNAALNTRNEELVEMTEKLENSTKTFRDFIDLTEIAAYMVDYDTGEIIIHNKAYSELLAKMGYRTGHSICFENVNHTGFCSFCPKEKLVDENRVPTSPCSWELYNEKADIWLAITSRALHWVDGRLAVMMTIVDVTNSKKEEERMAYLAYHDQMLGIPNGMKLNLDLQTCGGVYVVCFNIMGLREINNVYGRDAGDSLLCDIAEWFSAFQNDDVQLYRIKGDDFAVLIRKDDSEMAGELAEKIFDRFDSAWLADVDGEIQQKIYTNAHVGVIRITEAPESYSTFLNIIERVISFAKRENRPILFDKEMDEEFKRQMQLRLSLKNCVLNDMQGFSLNYQPVVNASTEQWVGLEALCRWNSPEIGNVPPDVFISEAERLGLIAIISDWVFEEAIRQAKEWKLDEAPRFSMSVNLSPVQLRDRDLLPKIRALLERYDYPIEKLGLEITETAEIHFDDRTITLLHDIREKGISLSLDDFGIGYATFSNLQNIPVAVLKIDRSFVNGIEKNAFMQRTMKIMVDYAHAAGLFVVAEGVETEEQREIIRYYGVNMIQGYYYSRPLSKEAMAEKLDLFWK